MSGFSKTDEHERSEYIEIRGPAFRPTVGSSAESEYEQVNSHSVLLIACRFWRHLLSGQKVVNINLVTKVV